MNILSDIKSRKILITKGILFLLTAGLSFLALLLKSLSVETLFLLLIFAWSSCRFYYFLFYVLEKYAGSDRKYAGIVDLIKALLRR